MIVDLENIYQWFGMWDHIPFQAYRCFMENVRKRKINDAEAIDTFRSWILYNRVTALIMYVNQTNDFKSTCL